MFCRGYTLENMTFLTVYQCENANLILEGFVVSSSANSRGPMGIAKSRGGSNRVESNARERIYFWNNMESIGNFSIEFLLFFVLFVCHLYIVHKYSQTAIS